MLLAAGNMLKRSRLCDPHRLCGWRCHMRGQMELGCHTVRTCRCGARVRAAGGSGWGAAAAAAHPWSGPAAVQLDSV